MSDPKELHARINEILKRLGLPPIPEARSRDDFLHPTHRCPCCFHKTLFGHGNDSMCPVCCWEDDGQDESDADQVRGGPNGSTSLREGQENFKKFGAYSEEMIGLARKPTPEEL